MLSQVVPLQMGVSLFLTTLFSHLANLFGAQLYHLLPLCLTLYHTTETGGLDIFTVNWSRWPYIYPFPPLVTLLLLQLCRHLRSDAS